VSGFGLDMQERAIRNYCKATGLQLVGVLRDEGKSGSNGLDQRVALAEAFARLKAKEAGTLVVYRIDRLARDLVLQETLARWLREQGTPVRSASEPDLDFDTDDGTKTLVRQVLGAISQYEKAVIRGRLMAGKAVKRERGGFLGGRPPYGFKVEGRELVDNPEEGKIVQLVGRLHLQGKSLREIIAALEAKELTPREGGRWHPNTVRRIAAQTPVPAGRPLPTTTR
jgi:DNA invertase Pin-like site-specific DNA recombinase